MAADNQVNGAWSEDHRPSPPRPPAAASHMSISARIALVVSIAGNIAMAAVLLAHVLHKPAIVEPILASDNIVVIRVNVPDIGRCSYMLKAQQTPLSPTSQPQDLPNATADLTDSDTEGPAETQSPGDFNLTRPSRIDDYGAGTIDIAISKAFADHRGGVAASGRKAIGVDVVGTFERGQWSAANHFAAGEDPMQSWDLPDKPQWNKNELPLIEITSGDASGQPVTQTQIILVRKPAR